MIERLLLVAWKGSLSVGWAETFRSSGYTVLLEETTGERAWRTAKERGIDCVVIDGEKKPSLGRQTGYQLRDTAKTRDIPIVWANLNPDEASLVQSDVRPDVTLPRPTDASEVIAAIVTLDAAREALRVSEQAPTPPEASQVEASEVASPAKSSHPALRKRPAVAKTAAEKKKPAVKTVASKQAASKEPATKRPPAAAKRVVAARTTRKTPRAGPTVRKPTR